MQQSFMKKYGPHLLALGIFIVVAVIFCYPALQGKVLNQHDYISWKSMTKEASDYYEKTGDVPKWSNSMFGGMPTYTTYLPGKSNFVFGLQVGINAIFSKPINFFLLSMIGFYLLMLALEVTPWIAIIAAIAASFASYNPIIIGAGHETKMFSIAYIPMVLAGIIWTYKGKRALGILVYTIAIALLFSNSHYQMIYYTLIVILCLGISALIGAVKRGTVPDFIKSTIMLVVIGVLGVLPTAIGMLTTKEYSKSTMRGGESELTINKKEKKTNGGLDRDYAFQWSNSIGETFCILVPRLYGGSSSESLGAGSHTYETLTSMGVPEQSAEAFSENLPLYWGPQPFLSGPVYFGAIVCFLLVLSLFVIRSRNKWWLFIAGVIAIVLSWGKHFGLNDFLFDHLPMYNKFRTPSMALAISQITFTALGFWGLYVFITEKTDTAKLLKQLRNSVIITAGLALVLGVGIGFTTNMTGEKDKQTQAMLAQQTGNEQSAGKLMSAIREDRSSAAQHDAMRSALLIILAGGILYAFAQKKVNGTVALVVLGALVTFDNMGVGMRYLNEKNYVEESDFEANFQPRPVDLQIMQDKDPYYRVFDLTKDTYNDAVQAYFHKSVGGYHPAKMEIFQDLINVQLFPQAGKLNKEVLNMLNTKYIVFNAGNQPAAQPNPEANGNAWFVNNIKWVNSADDEMNALNAENLGDTAAVPNAFRSKETAVVRGDFKKDIANEQIGKDSSAYIRLTKYGLNDLAFESNNSANGFGVFSDIYYNLGWKAYIDGKEAPIVRTDYVLRGLYIPAGKHEIKFEFKPASYDLGVKLSYFGSFSLVLVILGSLFFIFRKPETKA